MTKKDTKIWGGNEQEMSERNRFEMPPKTIAEKREIKEHKKVHYTKAGVVGYGKKKTREFEKGVHNSKAYEEIKQYLEKKHRWTKHGLAKAIGVGIEEGDFRYYPDVMDALKGLGMYKKDEGSRTYLKRRQKEFDREKKEQEKKEEEDTAAHENNAVSSTISQEDIAAIMTMIDDSRTEEEKPTAQFGSHASNDNASHALTP